MAQFPVEPCNTLSNVLFLIVVLYWVVRLKKISDVGFRKFLKLNIPFLFVGYVGGTIYHATRSHVVWMLMDVLPIYFIGFFTAIYHWSLIRATKITVGLIFLICFCLFYILITFIMPSSSNVPTIGYICLAVPVLLPILIDLVKTKGIFLKWFLTPFFLLIIALFFRIIDSSPWVQTHLPIGTHWLWHIFGALTCHFLLVYMEKRSLFIQNSKEAKTYL